jgi:Smad anchor for receptor activation-like, C-terminal
MMSHAMSFFDRLFGRPAAGAAAVTFPVECDLVRDLLRARVYFHQIDTPSGPLPCWTYVTDGLSRHGQKEIIFTLRCAGGAPPAAFPEDPLRLFATIDQFAQHGNLVDAGGVTQFAQTLFFGRHLMYIESQKFLEVPAPSDALAAILVTEDEVRTVREFGALRVMSRLGFATRYFPCPPWSDPDRDGVAFAPTVLENVRRGRVPGVRVMREGDRTSVRVSSAAINTLRRNLMEFDGASALAILTDLDPAANACLIWRPGQSRMEGIAPPGSDGSRLAGCFAMFVPGQDDNDARVFEDGFALMLTASAWDDVRQALTGATAGASISTGNGEILIEHAEMYGRPN